MVSIIAQGLTGLVAIEHVYILWIEMFAWETVGKKTFRSFPPELFKKTKGMMANQGFYNGFITAGLVWSYLIKDPVWSHNIAVFNLSFVALAGIFGGFTVSKRIFYLQALPAIAALAARYLVL